MDYREVFDTKIADISCTATSYLTRIQSTIDAIIPESIEDLREFREHYNTLDSNESTAKGMTITFEISSIKAVIESMFAEKLGVVESERGKLMLALNEKVEARIAEKKEEVRLRNEEIRSKNKELKETIEASNSVYRQLETKRQSLLEYSNDILQLCSDYGIKTSDISMDNNMFTLEELDTFYTEFLSFINSSLGKRSNPISWLREKVNYSPSTLGVITLGVLILAFTPVLDVMAIILILYLMYSQSTQQSMVKRYTIMAGLAFNINPMELGVIKDITDDMLEKELSDNVDVDNEPEFIELFESVNNQVKSIDDTDIRDERTKAIATYTKDYPIMEQEYKEMVDSIEKEKTRIIAAIVSKREELKKKEELLKADVKLLGTEFSVKPVMSTVLKLGINPDTLIYETVDVGMKNIVFNDRKTYGRGDDRMFGNIGMWSGGSSSLAELEPRKLDDFIKVVITNYLCNIRPGYLDIVVYDPNGMGRSLSGFYNKDMDGTVSIKSDGLEDIIKELKEHTETVIKTVRGKTINEYNEDAFEAGRTCLPYKMLVILSQPKSVEENEALLNFVQYSADLGVFVLMVSNNKIPNTYVFEEPFGRVKQPIKINEYEFPITVSENLHKAFSRLETKSLFWEDYVNVAIPDDKTWSGCTDEFIEIDPGFEDGDRSKYGTYTLGNVGDVHALCVGGTGAGKSVYINNVIANMSKKYSPKELKLWLVDFKGNEFSFYLPNPSIGRYNMLPHIRACLCTSDPDYSVSLFKAYSDEAAARYKLLAAAGHKNMYTYNKAMRKDGTPEKCLPRTLLIVDEFQIVFEKTGPKEQELLKKYITDISKVARACGYHLMFCSQSMKGTVPDDVLNMFDLRFALRCKMEVSMAIMGTKYAGNLREPNGYLYIASTKDKKAELQKKYRTPFLRDEPLLEHINAMHDLCKKEGLEKYVSKPIIYDETTIHPIEEIDAIYKSLDSKQELMVLGERMVYSGNGSKANIILERSNNQHIFSVFANTVDMVMFFNTVLCNIRNGVPSSTIYNSRVKDHSYLCHLDELVDDTNKVFLNDAMDPAAFLQIVNSINSKRDEVEDKEILKPLYIICIGWDKANGIGLSNSFKLTDAYGVLLQTCGVNHIHFIFICSSQAEIPKSMILACAYRIAGKCDDKSSMTLLDSDAAYKPYKQDGGYMFLFRSSQVSRLKIYQSVLTREIKIKELNL